MTTTPTVRIDDAGELIASVPALLGFTPERSLVAITLRERRVGLVTRADLPPSSNDYPQLARQMAQAAAHAHAEAVIAVVVDGADTHTDLAVDLAQALAAHDIPLRAAYQVSEIAASATWRSLLEPTITGALPDPTCTEIATTLVAAGHVTHASRDDMAAVLSPDGDKATERRAAAIDKLLREPPRQTDASAAVVNAALNAALDGTLPQGDRHVAELAVALSDPQVRDACLATAYPTGSKLARAAARLWQALTRAVPAPERAAPATLAAYAAYSDGNGALAGVALDAALAADPDYLLARLLLRALQASAPPELLRTLADNDAVGLLDAVNDPVTTEGRE